ncbi:MAG: ABC transporter substrate-binding protein [Thermodesulfovibrionales bacterium]
MKYFKVLVSVIALSGFLLLSCAKEKSAEIKLGAVLPLTGDTASYGKNAQNGIDLVVEEINQAGGIGGKKLVVAYEDDKGKANEAINAMNKLITINKVPVIMGSAGSSVTLAMSSVANQNKTVLITPISSSKELTDKGGAYFFRVCPSDAFQSRILADWIWDKGYKTVGMIYVNNSWGQGLKDEFVTRYEKKGGKVVIAEATMEGQKDFKTVISKVMGSKPDALFTPTYGIEGGILLKQLKEMKAKLPVFGADVWSSPELLTSAGNAAEGIYLTLPAKPSGPKYNVFAQKFKAKYGQEPDVYAAYSYDMMQIIALGLKEGNTTGEKMQTYLRAMPAFDGVTGTTKFDEHGDVVTKTFSKQIITSGKYVDVK